PDGRRRKREKQTQESSLHKQPHIIVFAIIRRKVVISMPPPSDPKLGINDWLEEELYQQYLHDHGAVDESWKHVFEDGNGQKAIAPQTAHVKTGSTEAGPAEQLVPMRGAAARIAENMNASLSLPLATSQRIIPVKVIDENRRIINQHRTLVGKSKISYTHIVGWAIVKALRSFPGLNHAF